MTKEEFIKIREKYKRDIDCIKGERFNKETYFQWKQEFGLSKRSKIDQNRAKTLTMTEEEWVEFKNKYKTNVERAKALNLSKNRYYEFQKRMNVSRVYDHSKIDKNKFLELYNDGLNDKEISKIIGTNQKRICAFRTKLRLRANTINEYSFTDEQFQVFLGGMYGDSCLRIPKGNKNAMFCFAHSLKQTNYALWKYEILKEFCFKPFYSKQHDKRNGNTYNEIRITSKTSELFTSFLKQLYKKVEHKRIKYINKELLWQLKPLGIAIWFMDDGYKNHNGYSLATNCFTEEDLEIIIEFFVEKYNIHPHIHGKNVLYITARERDLFTNIIRPYIQPELMYKLHPMSCKNSVNLENSSEEDNPNPSASEME